jgi:DNA-directed RNA polymerase subunit RPC12/RpoP
MGLIFGGLGLTMLCFLWGAGPDDFGAPPLVFRVFGSLISLAFVVVGFVAVSGALGGQGLNPDAARQFAALKAALPPVTPTTDDVVRVHSSYFCPRCGKPVGTEGDVSPHGDVRCASCAQWFNVRDRSKSS